MTYSFLEEVWQASGPDSFVMAGNSGQTGGGGREEPAWRDATQANLMTDVQPERVALPVKPAQPVQLPAAAPDADLMRPPAAQQRVMDLETQVRELQGTIDRLEAQLRTASHAGGQAQQDIVMFLATGAFAIFVLDTFMNSGGAR